MQVRLALNAITNAGSVVGGSLVAVRMQTEKVATLSLLSDDEAHAVLHRAAHVCLPGAPTLAAADKRMHALWHQDVHAKERLRVIMEPVHADIRARRCKGNWEGASVMDLEDAMSPEDWANYVHECTIGVVERMEGAAVNTRSILYGLKYTGRHDREEMEREHWTVEDLIG